MEYLREHNGREAEIVDLFTLTFTASEGEEEGTVIGELVRKLLSDTAQESLFVFIAEENGALIGGIIFSQLTYAHDERTVFVLGPVAVAPDQQGRGVGQGLLSYGLRALQMAGVDIVMTYGDPNYYTKVGFTPIREVDAPAPFPLNHPEGWLAQSLTGQPIAPLRGPSRCVEALDDPVYW